MARSWADPVDSSLHPSTMGMGRPRASTARILGRVGGPSLPRAHLPLPLSPQLAVSVGNTRFNEIMEATLPTQDCPKPSAGSDM